MQCNRMTAVLITALMVAGGPGNTAEAREPVRHGAPQAQGLAVVDHLFAHERQTVSKHRYQHRGQRYRHRRHFSGNRHRYYRGAPDHLGKPGYRYHGKHARYRALRPGYRIHGHYRGRAHRHRRRGDRHRGYGISIEYDGLRYHISGSGRR